MYILDSDNGSFRSAGVEVAVFNDNYASGHQSGISLIMNDKRMTNGGDIRFEQTPGQWQPVPVRVSRDIDTENNEITANMHFPDTNAHMKGFNPAIYPDLELDYHVKVSPCGEGVKVLVFADNPIPECLAGKACFNMEIVPVHVFGKAWMMDEETGIFPRQPNGPTIAKPANIDIAGVYDRADGKACLEQLLSDRNEYCPIVADNLIAAPYAIGHCFTALPDSELYRFTVKSEAAELKLYDGRMNHNNGWFVLSSELPTGKSGCILEWYIEPAADEKWRYESVIQLSQVGYHPSQNKVAVIECDSRFCAEESAVLYKISRKGPVKLLEKQPELWGKFLRYSYYKFDFSTIKEEGLYKIEFAASSSHVFRVSKDIYDRGVWQPVLEYFLPVQMCHMLVREKYRTWHGLCHMDDAVMAPVDYNHFDGYYQGPDTLCKYKPGEHVPGLNAGGWHDAGDYDLRIESQAGEIYALSLAYEEFNVNYDSTSIDQSRHLVEIHQPDGKNDILQQIEHGLISVTGAYEVLGRLYRGIICRDLRQYVLLGDASTMTDGTESEDDRWVFTEDNPRRELDLAGQLAAAYRAMKGFNDMMAQKALEISKELYVKTDSKGCELQKVNAAIELFLSTGEAEYRSCILENTDCICNAFEWTGWIAVRAIDKMNDDEFTEKLRKAALSLKEKYNEECAKNPYGVPFRPGAWGSGWGIQAFGAHYHFLRKAFPEIFDAEPMFNALNFVLGCHPGKNTAAFASGVGAKSMTVAYGANRADYSYIPGGVSSGTELISPDFPELLEYPFLWQQGEYVLGGGSSNYMFLVLAVADCCKHRGN